MAAQHAVALPPHPQDLTLWCLSGSRSQPYERASAMHLGSLVSPSNAVFRIGVDFHLRRFNQTRWNPTEEGSIGEGETLL